MGNCSACSNAPDAPLPASAGSPPDSPTTPPPVSGPPPSCSGVPLPCQPASAATSLRQALGELLLRTLPPKEGAPFGAVLVLDSAAVAFTEAVLQVTDLTGAGLPLLEPLPAEGRRRQPLPKLPCVYLVDPSAEVAERIYAEWQPPEIPDEPPEVVEREDGTVAVSMIVPAYTGPPHSRADVYTLGKATPEFLEGLAGVPIPLGVREFPAGFVCAGQSLYCIFPQGDSRGGPLPYLSRGRSQHDVRVALERVADGITSVSQVLGVTSSKGRRWWQNTSSPSRTLVELLGERGVGADILVVDRTHDPVAPLAFSQDYEAQLLDSLTGDDAAPIGVRSRAAGRLEAWHTVRTGDGEKREDALFQETDPLWVLFRDLNVNELTPLAKKEAKQATKVQAALQRPAETATTEDLRSRVLALAPDTRRAHKLVSLHIDLLHALRGATGKAGDAENPGEGKLGSLTLLQQDALTGTIGADANEEEGGKLTPTAAWARFERIARMGAAPPLALLRTALLLHACFESDITASARNSGRGLARSVEPHPLSFDSLTTGMELMIRGHPSRWSSPPEDLNEDGSPKYLLSRAAPRLRHTAQQLVQGTLSSDEYGGQGREERRRSSVGVGLRLDPTLAGDGDRRKRRRVHLFVIGGISPAEISAVRGLAARSGVDILIGSTGIISPNEYVRYLPDMNG
eukprot:Hpha_TRINITY_DN34138_c0_g1::TRINITY_DN34138_c0_g1_i1::g.75781::m.75781/K15292/STXBP1, MUNC18-1; syntaxin-binding protein 1